MLALRPRRPPDSSPPSRRRRVARLLLVALVAFAAYAGLARWVLHGPVDSRSLQRSVSLEVGADLRDELPCRPAGRGAWTCSVTYEGGSRGTDAYAVRTSPGGSCWTARRRPAAAAPTSPARAEGCVHRWQWKLLGSLAGEPSGADR